jgi:heme-degrading monooxygenase HmoA
MFLNGRICGQQCARFLSSERARVMLVIVFRSRLADGHADEYATTSTRMIELASGMPGFVSFKTFTAADGERVSLVEFESEEAAAAWREHPEHRQAQRRGREAFYQSYSIQVCHEVRRYGFER